ncbi:MAG: cation diffusion facilitator family transporter [Thermoplasmata archaeon]
MRGIQNHSGHEGKGGGHDMAAMYRSNERALKLGAWLTGIYFVIELGLAVISGSVAVLSDAFHTFSAVGGVVLALVAGRIAARPADRYRTFGSFRAEILGAMFNGVFLLAMAGLVFYVGILRLLNPTPVESTFMIFAAIGGIVTESISLAYLYRGQKENLNVRGAYWHVVQTFVGSILIIVAAVVISFTGFLQIDPILGIGFGGVLVWASVGIIREATGILMDTVPTDVDVVKVQKVLRHIEGVKDVHHVHAWALTSGKNLFSAHLLIEDAADHERVLDEARTAIRTRFGFYFSTMQVEKSNAHEEGAEEIDFADDRPTSHTQRRDPS